ncbi:MAG: glucuronate isomerase [Actinomycetaceae bacterium]|nr:glucuronate isomerase [Actinomycetaceae bacterium]
MAFPLHLDPDRLFPVDPATRDIARELYKSVADLPIISPHGHVDPQMVLDNQYFSDPAELFLTYDHYVFRLLNAAGVDLHDLGVGKAAPVDPRQAWRIFCRHWPLFDGTASGYWLTHEFVTLFGITEEPCEDNADALFDLINSRIHQDDFLPQRLLERFDIEVLATTDDPLDSLQAHHALAQVDGIHTRIIPTWRPDAYSNARKPQFVQAAAAMAASAGGEADDFAAFMRGLRASRERFIAAGAVSTDHGVSQPLAVELTDEEAGALYRRAVADGLQGADADAFEGAMLMRFAQMAVEDGLVMTVHPGVYRNHCSQAFADFGADTGHDIPVSTEYTRKMQPLLDKFGQEKDFHLVLFTIDETVYSRELAPLAGFYRSVYVGAPWWFIDEPDAIGRWRAAVTGTLGFSRTSGFIDDTRAYLSIPARHDMARRADAAFLARYVREGRLSEPAAMRAIHRLTDTQPRHVFKLG